MNITFLIGNGFDLNLGLNTTYSDFVKYYVTTKAKNENLQAFRTNIEKNEDLWSSAEITMGKYTEEFVPGAGAQFSECQEDFCEQLSIYLKQQEKRIDYEYISQNILGAFSQLDKIASIFPAQTREILQQVYKKHIAENIKFNFINYNYTYTLDRCVAQAKKLQPALGTHIYGTVTYNHSLEVIRHVHGTVDSQMVFGVNDETQITNSQIFECEYGDIYKKAFIKIQANQSYQENTDVKAKNMLDSSQLVCVYGMSIGATDKLWWERICKWLSSNSERHLIIFKHGMPPKSVLQTQYSIEERKCKKEITQYAQLNNTQKEEIENRIHVTDNNIFEKIKNTADKTSFLEKLEEQLALNAST